MGKTIEKLRLKNFCLPAVLLLFICAAETVFAADWRDGKNKFSFSYPGEWQVKPLPEHKRPALLQLIKEKMLHVEFSRRENEGKMLKDFMTGNTAALLSLMKKKGYARAAVESERFMTLNRREAGVVLLTYADDYYDYVVKQYFFYLPEAVFIMRCRIIDEWREFIEPVCDMVAESVKISD